MYHGWQRRLVGGEGSVSAEIDSYWSNDKFLHITMATESSLSVRLASANKFAQLDHLSPSKGLRQPAGHSRLQTFFYFLLFLSLLAQEEIVFFISFPATSGRSLIQDTVPEQTFKVSIIGVIIFVF